ncbi:hypothetical protein [Okeania sp. SIO2B3]|nr:hypothetical protein [Okeania sp. SIO2B3]
MFYLSENSYIEEEGRKKEKYCRECGEMRRWGLWKKIKKYGNSAL